MSNAKPYLFGAVLGASAMYVALQYHVVHSHDGFQMVPRTPQHSVGLAYADVRNWSPSQWTDRPELARALMAHGSSDLISESVANSLADSVMEENSTLDQLRSFLEKSSINGASGNAAGLLEIPATPRKPLDVESSTDDEMTRIPFPQDAKIDVIADPFRVAQGSEIATAKAVQIPKPTVGTSRFSAADVIDGLRENADNQNDSLSAAAPQSMAGTRTNGTKTLDSRTTAQAIEDQIFGNSVKGSSSNPSPSNATTTSASDSMFEEVSTQLENRAQAALNRAKELATEKAGSVTNGATKSSESYIRKNIEESAPSAVKSAIKNVTPETTTPSAASPLDQFDPFLE